MSEKSEIKGQVEDLGHAGDVQELTRGEAVQAQGGLNFGAIKFEFQGGCSSQTEEAEAQRLTADFARTSNLP